MEIDADNEKSNSRRRVEEFRGKGEQRNRMIAEGCGCQEKLN